MAEKSKKSKRPTPLTLSTQASDTTDAPGELHPSVNSEYVVCNMYCVLACKWEGLIHFFF